MIRGLCAVLAAACAAGCVNGDVRLYEVRVRGATSVAPLMDGTGAVHLEFHVAHSKGEGALAHPLGPFARRTLPGLGAVDETVLHPLDDGDGLVIYGWLDRDGDGRLCAPGKGGEPAGAVEVKPFPAHEAAFALVLDRACAGPEALYP